MTIPADFLGERACAGCGAVAKRQTVRFRCSECGYDNRPTRTSLPGGRAKTETARDMNRKGARHLRLVQYEEPSEPRPKTRADCKGGIRPCPWVGCRYHLAYEVTAAGGLKEKFPGKELEELAHTCVLDVTDEGPQSLDTIAFLTNVTQERVRQIESQALESFKDALVITEDDL